MRKFFLISIFLVVLTPSVFGLRLENYDVLVDIREDVVHETVKLDFTSKETKFDLFVLAPVSNLKVIGDSGKSLSCFVERQTLGDLIVCENFDERGLTMDFDVHGLIEKKKNFRIFSYLYILTRPTENFHLKVKLPVGSVFADEKKLEGTGLKPFKPLGGVQGTDGRRIFIEWELKKPPLGQSLDVQVIFEPSVELSPSIMAITIAAVAIMLGIFFFMSRGKPTIETVMTILNDDEKKVVNLLMEKGVLTQKQIARECDFSKPKVSRLVTNLEERGIVEKRPVGRTNKVKLKENFEEKEGKKTNFSK